MDLIDSFFDDLPPPAFYFKVVIAGNVLSDNSFQDISGITTELETEPLIEGGNPYVTHLPKAIKHQNLVLKRGIADLRSPLVLWCRSVMEAYFAVPVVPMPVAVYLMNADRLPIRAWTFFNAFPVKWEVQPFSSTKNEIAIEQIELSYSYSSRLI